MKDSWRQLRLKARKERARLSKSHVLPPVNRRHAPLVLVIWVCSAHEQVVDNIDLVVIGSIEKACPTGLQGKQNPQIT